MWWQECKLGITNVLVEDIIRTQVRTDKSMDTSACRRCVHELCAQHSVLADLRYAEAGDGEPGDKVPLELAEGVVPAPVQHREDVLQAEPQLLGPRLVLVLPQRVVGEEGLLHRVGELRKEALLGWEADLVAVLDAVRAVVR